MFSVNLPPSPHNPPKQNYKHSVNTKHHASLPSPPPPLIFASQVLQEKIDTPLKTPIAPSPLDKL